MRDPCNLEEYDYMKKEEMISVLYMQQDTDYHHRHVHMHNRNELLFITNHTSTTIFSNGNRQTVPTPALIFHRAGSYHYTDSESPEKSGYTSYCVFFDTQYISQIPETFLHSRSVFFNDCLILPLTDAQVEKYKSYLQLMYAEKGLHKKQLFLLLCIIDETHWILHTAEAIKLNNPSDYIFDVTKYLIDHYDEQITTEQLAKHFYVSVSKLNADFNRITNTTIKDFHISIRLGYAMQLLRDTDKPLSEISYACGFSSESYMIQSFRRSLQMTPSEYRKTTQKER